jgi:hypothetical protein
VRRYTILTTTNHPTLTTTNHFARRDAINTLLSSIPDPPCAATVMSPGPSIELNNGVSMPVIGYGTYMRKDDYSTVGGITEAVKTALALGYRHLDCASFYGNEKEVGCAIRESHVPRKDIFVTGKVYMHISIYAYMHISIYVYMYICTCGYIYIYTYMIEHGIQNLFVSGCDGGKTRVW